MEILNEKVVITIPGKDSLEKWALTLHDIIDLLQCQDENMLSRHPYALEFVKYMLPSHDQIMKG